ncbi:ubiquitin carboxyl-terminal hydrolase [Emydomyces testavorans]|uniref:ubiquitinyl hydrolase 1 n=1 Tax=Emydomyces testavorans TaxID=2070801 RepID=A0AAF0IKB1_9EURO|nr:ubiquitin carboxyl-terminal hydrolase [Emydomyces testavorans]
MADRRNLATLADIDVDSYCNSILQCLYYSAPFRESVINYPRRSPPEVLADTVSNNLRYPDPNTPLEELLKPKTLLNPAGRPNLPLNQPQKPEDKDSGEYKKKVALHTLPLLETTDNSSSYGMKESLFTSLKDIFEAIAASPERMGVIRPYHFLEVLRREHEMFRTTMHQDAHEFLNLLLNEVVSNVEADANLISDMDEQSDNSEESSESTSSSLATTPSNSMKSSQNTRWVHELFEGTLTSETQCLTCETVSQRDEVFLDLSVDLEQHTSVTSCLRKFSEEEVLCEHNKFHCDNCGGLQEAEKRMKIKRLPKILALHLKRFKYSEDLDRLQKLFYRVVYPYYLRLFNTTDDAEDPDRLYELYAVVVHIGGGPYHGHYVAIIKTEDRGWLLFDDEMVEPVDKNFVRNFFGDRPGLGSAYVLFYQETTFEAMQQELAKENAITARSLTELKDPVLPLPKTNGHLTPPGKINHAAVDAVHAVDNAILTPVKHILSAPPQLSRNSEEMSSTSLSNLLPHPKSPLSSFIPRMGDLHIKKDRTKEEKERRAAEREKEKLGKQKQKETEARKKQNRKREEAQLKAAIEESKITKADEDRRNAGAAKGEKENGLPRVGGLNRFRLGTRSVSQSKLFHREKEIANEVPDVPPIPPLDNFLPEPATDVSSPAHPSNASTDDDKDDSTNATSVSMHEPQSLNTRTTALPAIPSKETHGDLERPRRQAVPKRSRFSLRKKSFSVF